MKPIKVLHLVPPGFGGIDAYIFGHYRHMDREAFRFDFLTRNTGLETAPQYRDLDYSVRLLPVTAAGNRELFENTVREILADGYDVFHIHTSYWTGFLLEELAREAGVKKTVVHAHSTFIDEPDGEKRAALLLRHEEIKKAFPAGLATDFWACSQLAADWLFGPQIQRDQIKVMKNAIEVEKYRFNPQARRAVREKLGLKGELVLGTVGRFSYQKAPSFLLDVFLRFHRKHPRSKLLMVGDGELRKDLEEQIRKNRLENDVYLPGWKTDVENYLQAMDAFLLPSRFEGLSVSAVEAAASGLPCIVSDRVTEEIEAIKTIRRVPLELSRWIDVLEERLAMPDGREAGAGVVRLAGYDVTEQAKVLERQYIG